MNPSLDYHLAVSSGVRHTYSASVQNDVGLAAPPASPYRQLRSPAIFGQVCCCRQVGLELLVGEPVKCLVVEACGSTPDQGDVGACISRHVGEIN